MELNEIVTLGNERYLLTQRIVYDKHYYYMATLLNAEGTFAGKFGVMKELRSKGERYLQPLTEEKELQIVYAMLIDDFNKIVQEENKDFMEVGQVVDIEDREYALISYVAYEGLVYMIFMTLDKPLDIRVAQLDNTEDGEKTFYDVTETPTAIEVLKLHAELEKAQKAGKVEE